MFVLLALACSVGELAIFAQWWVVLVADMWSGLNVLALVQSSAPVDFFLKTDPSNDDSNVCVHMQVGISLEITYLNSSHVS